MLPRWFRVVLAGEIAGLAVFVVLGIHVLGQGVHTAGDALTWLRPAPHSAPRAQARSSALPSLVNAAPTAPQHALYGAALLNPSLMVRLNRDTGATAVGEYALLLNLEALAREEVTRLLRGISVSPAAVTAGR